MLLICAIMTSSPNRYDLHLILQLSIIKSSRHYKTLSKVLNAGAWLQPESADNCILLPFRFVASFMCTMQGHTLKP